MTKKIFFIALFTAILATSTNAQVCAIAQTQDGCCFANIKDQTAVGQTFKACLNGYITKIRVNFFTRNASTFRLQLSKGVTTVRPDYVQDFTVTTTGWVDINLAQIFPVEAGEQYAFSIRGTVDVDDFGSLLVSNNGTLYPDGIAFREVKKVYFIDSGDRLFEIEFASFDCRSTITNVKLNNAGSVAVVAAGARVAASMDYSVATACAGCINQLPIALRDSAMNCAFQGQASCSNKKTGTFTTNITASARPAVYPISYNFRQERSCDNALTGYARNGRFDIGSIVVCGASHAYNITLNGAPRNYMRIKTGEKATLNGSYTLANTNVCPLCNHQFVVGVENTPLRCVYNGQAPICPNNKTDTFSLQLNNLPVGQHRIYALNALQFNCMDAQNQYRNDTDNNRVLLGIVEVTNSVSANETAFDPQLRLAPNPASDAFTLTYTLARRAPVQIELWAPDGRLLRRIDHVLPSGEHAEQIEVSDMTPGIYYCVLGTDIGRVVQKFTVAAK